MIIEFEYSEYICMYVRFKKWSKGFKIRKCTSCKYRAVLHTNLVVYYCFFVTAQNF